MGVSVRQKIKGKGQPWWVFINVNGTRRTKRIGDRQAAEAVASARRRNLKAGELSIPQGDNDIYRLDLKADSIDLARYMAPAVEGASAVAADEAPIEIPTELIRLINARGSLKVDVAQRSGMRFENVTLGLNTSNGKLRLHPITATLFEGSYNGDVRIDASGSTPVMSVNVQAYAKTAAV